MQTQPRLRCLMLAVPITMACGQPGPDDTAGADASSGPATTHGSTHGGTRGSEDDPGDEGSEGDGTGGSDGALDTTDGDGASSDGGPSDPAAWLPPIGIPAPEFGIVETAEACAACEVITTSDVAALEDIPPGTIVELEGGPHIGSALTISGNGTADAPVFVRSKDPAQPVVLTYDVEISGSYLIVEHLDFDQGLRDQSVGVSGDHIAVRHSSVHAFRPGHFSTALHVSNAEHVVLWDNEIHDNGDFAVAGEHDVHGIGGSNMHRLWIVDSHLHHNRGDSMQFGHQAGNSLGDIYVGRNHIHDDGENCVDIKEASNVVVSENELHDPGGGVAVVFHDCPVNASAIYNEIYDSPVGLSLPSLEDACGPHLPVELFVTRNDISSVTTGIEGWGSGKRYFVAGNAFAGGDSAIEIDNEGPGSILSPDDTDIDAVFAAFEAVYGIAIDG
ncbi:MAG: right-handed parallel beta-helix repeat-containing protein [Myxococcota bacterium]